MNVRWSADPVCAEGVASLTTTYFRLSLERSLAATPTVAEVVACHGWAPVSPASPVEPVATATREFPIAQGVNSTEPLASLRGSRTRRELQRTSLVRSQSDDPRVTGMYRLVHAVSQAHIEARPREGCCLQTGDWRVRLLESLAVDTTSTVRSRLRNPQGSSTLSLKRRCGLVARSLLAVLVATVGHVMDTGRPSGRASMLPPEGSAVDDPRCSRSLPVSRPCGPGEPVTGAGDRRWRHVRA